MTPGLTDFRAATPVFGSPEQLGGELHRKTDNYGMGRIIGLGCCEWNTGWGLICDPVDPKEKQKIIAAIKKDPFHKCFFEIVEDLVKVNIAKLRSRLRVY